MGFSWIEEVVTQYYPRVNWGAGIDLDQSGRVEAWERLRDVDQDGIVGSPADWEQFHQDNATALSHQIAFFRDAAAANLAADNPLHEVLAIESEVCSAEEVRAVYQVVAECLQRARAIIQDPQQYRLHQVGVFQRMPMAMINPWASQVVLIYEQLQAMGIQFAPQERILLAQHIRDKRLDRATLSFVVRAVAHELGLPLALISAHGDVFPQWNGLLSSFDIDQGVIRQASSLNRLSADESRGLYFANRGAAKHTRGDVAGAIADYTEAIYLNPRDSAAFNNRGVAKKFSGDVAGAIADYTEVIRLDPQNAAAFNNLGIAKQDNGDVTEAIADYTMAIRLNPQYADAFYNRGIAKNINWDISGAIADYTAAIRLNPQHAEAFYKRGLAKQASADVAGAIADYTATIRLDPRSAAAFNNRGAAKFVSGDVVGAIDDYTAAIRLNPRDVAALSNRGLAKSAGGDISGAIADYTEAIRLDPQNATALYNRGLAKQATGDVKGASADFAEANRLLGKGERTKNKEEW